MQRRKIEMENQQIVPVLVFFVILSCRQNQGSYIEEPIMQLCRYWKKGYIRSS